MGLILNLETSTKACSVSLAKDGVLLSLQEASEEKFSHAEKLHLFIEKAIREADIQLKDLDAIAVGMGPGSYTGLRIGVSSAKGLAYGLDKPLIAISSLQTLAAAGVLEQPDLKYFCPMLDARRMEVFTAVYDQSLQIVEPIEAIVLESDFRSKQLEEDKVVFLGDGSEKLKSIVTNENAVYVDIKYPSSKEMIEFSHQKFMKSEFEDSAYFEPFYLKDFVAGKPKKIF